MLWKTLKNNHCNIVCTINIDVNEKNKTVDHEDDLVWEKNNTFIVTVFRTPMYQ